MAFFCQMTREVHMDLFHRGTCHYGQSETLFLGRGHSYLALNILSPVPFGIRAVLLKLKKKMMPVVVVHASRIC